jgi:hypothetical protein
MTKSTDLHLDTTLSLAVLLTGLVVGFAPFAADQATGTGERFAAQDAVTVTQDGRYKMTVTAQRPRDFVPATHQVSASEAAVRPAPART